MNKTTLKEKESYEAPEVLDIKPVSVAVRGGSEDQVNGEPEDQAGGM